MLGECWPLWKFYSCKMLEHMLIHLTCLVKLPNTLFRKTFALHALKVFRVRIRIRSFTRSSTEKTIFLCKMSTIFIECVGLFCHVYLSSQPFHLNSPHFRWNYLAATKFSYDRKYRILIFTKIRSEHMERADMEIANEFSIFEINNS